MAKKKQGGNTVSLIWDIAKPIADSLGLDIWDIRFLKEGSQWYLRIFIDSENGVTIEDCESMSRAIDAPLDEVDPISVSYCLEVCSPGLERELVRPEHFERFIGANVIVRMIRPLKNGQKEFCAKLLDFKDGNITVINNEENISFNKKDAVFVKLDDFDN